MHENLRGIVGVKEKIKFSTCLSSAQSFAKIRGWEKMKIWNGTQGYFNKLVGEVTQKNPGPSQVFQTNTPRVTGTEEVQVTFDFIKVSGFTRKDNKKLEELLQPSTKGSE